MLYPFKLTPAYKDYIWGGRNLERMGKAVPKRRIAESWELSAMPGNENKIANGPLKDHSISDVISKYGMLILGDKFAPNALDKGLPVLLKFIDANERLSVQVHPDDKYAQKHENGQMGKTEMWYILDAKPSATVIHGFSEGYKPDEIRDAILMSKHGGLYREIPVKKGDMVFVPAGTVHALNDGLVVAEIQQNSDLTYRLFDYDRTDSAGRRRPLHVNKALDVLDYRNHKALYTGLDVYSNSIITKYLAISKYFCVKLIESKGVPLEFIVDGSFSAFMFINGEAEIMSKIENVKISALETVLIPAYMGNCRIEGTFSALQIFAPDSVSNVYNSLMDEGFSSEEIIKNIAGVEKFSVSLQMAV